MWVAIELRSCARWPVRSSSRRPLGRFADPQHWFAV